jgi:hypothetical protein
MVLCLGLILKLETKEAFRYGLRKHETCSALARERRLSEVGNGQIHQISACVLDLGQAGGRVLGRVGCERVWGR